MAEIGNAMRGVRSGTSLFKIGIKNGESLVVTLLRLAQVVSWAPLHGGPRTYAREILIRRVEQDFNAVYGRITLRRAASRARLTGTIVGMCTSAQISDYAVGRASYEELQAETLCIADTSDLAMVGESATFVERLSSRRSCQADQHGGCSELQHDPRGNARSHRHRDRGQGANAPAERWDRPSAARAEIIRRRFDLAHARTNLVK
jgi:Adenosylcobinamide amidohydrolase